MIPVEIVKKGVISHLDSAIDMLNSYVKTKRGNLTAVIELLKDTQKIVNENI